MNLILTIYRFITL